MNRLPSERSLEMMVAGLDNRANTMQGALRQILAMAATATAREIRPVKRKQWTCKKCRETFHPRLSKSWCDTCIKKRDGDM